MGKKGTLMPHFNTFFDWKNKGAILIKKYGTKKLP